MSISVKVGRKKYRIKPISKLSTKEFIEFSKLKLMVNKETSLLTTDSIIKYIAWQLSLPEDKAFYTSTSSYLELLIGPVLDITKIKRPSWVDYKKLIDTMGQRHQVERSRLDGFELILFCLAVSQARSNNIDDVEKIRQECLNLPYYETLPAGVFFFKNCSRGKKGVLNFSRKLFYSRRIRRLRNKLVLKD